MISVNFEQGNSSPRIVRITTDSTLSQVIAAGWYKNLPPNQLVASDNVEIAYAQGTSSAATSIFDVAISSLGVVTLTLAESSVVLPVVSGDFANFTGTSGAIRDAGFSPSDATKTKVVMAGSAVQVGYIAHFIDVAGTIDDTAGAVINAGTIQSGLAGTVGGFIAYPPTAANGFLELLAINAGGAFNTIISNSAMGQTSTISIPDPGASTANFVLSSVPAGQTVSASSASATPGTIRALTGAMTETNAVMTSGNVVGVRGSVTNVGASGGFVYGAQGKIISSGTLSGSSWSAGVFGQLDISAATVNAGQMAPIWGDYGTSSGTMTDTTGLRGVVMTNTTAAVLNAQDYRYGNATFLLELAGAGGVLNYISSAGAGSVGANPVRVAIQVNGATKYLIAADDWT